MDDEVKNQKVNKSKKRRHRRKHYTMLPYFTTPLIFVMISMIVIIPASFVAMKFAVNIVHKAQEVMTQDFNDIEPNMEFEPSSVEDGVVALPSLYPAQKIGVITCKNAGLMADVYCGINRVSLRNGVGFDGEASAFGQGGNVNVYGYRSTYFKALKNVEIGDEITVQTSWGLYTYQVTNVKESNSSPSSTADETLYLATSKDDDAFSNFDGKKLFVVAKLVSGPAIEEVQ